MQTLFSGICFAALICAIIFGIKSFKNKQKNMLLPFAIAVVICIGSSFFISSGDEEELLAVTPTSESEVANTILPENENTPEITQKPTSEPTEEPAAEPTLEPTVKPTTEPTPVLTQKPTQSPEPIATTSPQEVHTNTPTEEPAAQETNAQLSGIYVGSLDSDKFHYPSCRFAKEILPENEIWFDSADEAESRGYAPCGVCHPA